MLFFEKKTLYFFNFCKWTIFENQDKILIDKVKR